MTTPTPPDERSTTCRGIPLPDSTHVSPPPLFTRSVPDPPSVTVPLLSVTTLSMLAPVISLSTMIIRDGIRETASEEHTCGLGHAPALPISYLHCEDDHD